MFLILWIISPLRRQLALCESIIIYQIKNLSAYFHSVKRGLHAEVHKWFLECLCIILLYLFMLILFLLTDLKIIFKIVKNSKLNKVISIIYTR